MAFNWKAAGLSSIIEIVDDDRVQDRKEDGPVPEQPGEPQPDPAEVMATVADIARYARRVAKGAMRTAYIARRLRAMADETAIAVLDELVNGAGLGRLGFHEALVDLIDPAALRDHLGDFFLSRIYHGARRAGRESIVRFLTEERPIKVQTRPSEENLMFGLGDIPLGSRKSVARLQNVRLLAKAGYDQDPKVIENLLRNPRTTREMVLKIASRRPNEAKVLEEIFRSQRWITDPVVKEALVRNPYTPPRIAMGLLNVLMLQQLRDVAQDTGLHPKVREAAEETLRRKEGSQAIEGDL